MASSGRRGCLVSVFPAFCDFRLSYANGHQLCFCSQLAAVSFCVAPGLLADGGALSFCCEERLHINAGGIGRIPMSTGFLVG